MPPPLPRITGQQQPPPPRTTQPFPPMQPAQPLPPLQAQPLPPPQPLPLPPVLPPPGPPPASPANADRGSLHNALSPGPAAQRREASAPRPAFEDDFDTGPVHANDSKRVVVAAAVPRTATVEPPPTHIQRPEAHADRPFTPPKVIPIPEIPEPSLLNAARYTIHFWRARWQRRGAIKTLGAEIKQDTEALDQVLGALGRVARNAGVDSRVFSAENASITTAEERVAALGVEQGDVESRRADENSKFLDVETERNTKLGEAERMVDEAQKELSHLEAQRRGLRDKRKELERRQRAYLKGAEDSERAAGSAQMGEQRQEHRRAAEQYRREAAALEPERQEMDRRLAALERPIGEATARLDAAKAELDAAKRSLSDAREGHTHRLAELDSEQKRKAREIAIAESEIAQRLVTLGTLVNLNRIDDARFAELYQRIDRLRGAITARTSEIEKLAAERVAYDRGTLVRGVSTIFGAIVAFIALIVILRALI